MNYEKIIYAYLEIVKRYATCDREFNESYEKLTAQIKKEISQYSTEEHSAFFSVFFELWLLATASEPSIYFYYSDDDINIKYKQPANQHTYTPDSTDHDVRIVAARDLIEESYLDTDKEENVLKIEREDRIRELLESFSILNKDSLPDAQKIIEFALGELWIRIFKNQLVSIGSSGEIIPIANNNYPHKNWPLYELLNQVGKILNKIENGKNTERTYSSLDLFDMDDVIAHTEELCLHILDIFILNEHKSSHWIPEVDVCKEIKLPYIIATSELVSYLSSFRLMSTKKRNQYLNNVNDAVIRIYNNTINRENHEVYDGINTYINKKINEVSIIEYKNYLISPKVVLVFTTAIIQEVVRKSLTQSKNNIFYVTDKRYRDSGISENSIIEKIKKDVKAYKLVLHYLDKPVPATIKKKEEKINNWLIELNKLRFGVFDDYLFDLAKASRLSFKEQTVTSIRMTPQ